MVWVMIFKIYVQGMLLVILQELKIELIQILEKYIYFQECLEEQVCFSCVNKPQSVCKHVQKTKNLI